MNDTAAPAGVETAYDSADPVRIAGLAALLDHVTSPWKSGMLPPLAHWLCFPPHVRQAKLGPDGHPKIEGGGLLPKSDLPRRMWAGSRVRFLEDVPIGAKLVRRSSLLSATPKEGRSGRMLFVTLKHEIEADGVGLAIVEEQDIVYREAARPSGAPPSRPPASTFVPTGDQKLSLRQPDEVLLFRFSALTFNAHRIHYDRDYSREVEGYPDLVVQGPLVATLLMDHLLTSYPDADVTSFEFRALSPLFAGDNIALVSERTGACVELTAEGPAGTAMRATVRIGEA